ncbi:hypothetical protein KW805_01610 [Candidatus Pacearchaeota archaeon]|nr:hypothetical protein [Candidatus Pacearchaeota archaeon]
MADKTKLVGVRFEMNMLKQIDEFADRMGIDRNQVIKIAVQEHIDNTEDEIDEQLIEDYINLIATEEEVKDRFEWKEIPQDIRKARELNLSKKGKAK